MRSRRGGYVGAACSHHPARMRRHPSSGRRGYILLGTLSNRSRTAQFRDFLRRQAQDAAQNRIGMLAEPRRRL